MQGMRQTIVTHTNSKCKGLALHSHHNLPLIQHNLVTIFIASTACSSEGGQALLDVIGHIDLLLQAIDESRIICNAERIQLQRFQRLGEWNIRHCSVLITGSSTPTIP